MNTKLLMLTGVLLIRLGALCLVAISKLAALDTVASNIY